MPQEVESKELQYLLEQKESLGQREDLSTEEKKKLAKSLRRRIRKLRAAVTSGEHSEEFEEQDLSDEEEYERLEYGGFPEESTRQERRRERRQRRRAKEIGLVMILNAEQKESYLATLLETLETLVPIEEDGFRSVETYAYSGALIIDEAQNTGIKPQQMAKLMVEKFNARWDRRPYWYSIYFEGKNPIFCFGPLPTHSGKRIDN
jgi:hypothetical protein